MSDLQKETPKDQEWIYYPDFEKKLYDPKAILPKCEAITPGPGFHWFSYYDKYQTDPTDRFVLGMQAEFENRSPTSDDYIKIGMVDLQDNNQWVELGKSCAWCWQQGCMLQWRPISNDEILWNDRVKDKFVCHILNVHSGQKKTIEHPIYHVSLDGKTAVTLDFTRLDVLRPGYGYPGVKCDNIDRLRPSNSGISLVDLETGSSKPLFSVNDIANIKYSDSEIDDDIHYFNAPAWNPDGSRFLFLNRWRSKSRRFADFRTRMFTASADGSDLRLVTDKPHISHFAWRDKSHITMWREDGYKLYKDNGSGAEESMLDATNGHLSFLNDPDWMVADTYVDKNDCQNPYLYNIFTQKVIPLGHFKSYGVLTGELRCDLHPRLTRDQKKIIIDSTHSGNGRQLYMLDIAGCANR